MTPLLFDKDMIEKATRSFSESPGTFRKTAWWLQRAHSCERWLQFEWAFHLQQTLGTDYLTACEVNYLDVVCYQRSKVSSDITKTKPEAGFELKHYGTWWVDPRFPEIATDLQKVDQAEIPTMALVFVHHVVPKPDNPLHDWIVTQSGSPPHTLQTVKEALHKTFCERKFFSLIIPAPEQKPEDKCFETLELGVFGFLKNELP